MSSVTVYISIGNSDDRLTQAEWSRFCDKVDSLLGGYSDRRHGAWFSLPMVEYQNACWCVELSLRHSADVRTHLRDLAREYRQDAITWAEATTVEMLGAVAGHSRTEDGEERR